MDGNVAALYRTTFRRSAARVRGSIVFDKSMLQTRHEGVTYFDELGCLDAPPFIPAGSMRRVPTAHTFLTALLRDK